jgi:hypothetical protein
MDIDRLSVLRGVGEALAIQIESPYYYGGVAASHRVYGDCGVFDGLPGDFEQQPLLRVQSVSLPRRDGKGLRVKLENVVLKKGCSLHIGLPRHAPIGTVVRVNLPPIFRDLGDGVFAPEKKV